MTTGCASDREAQQRLAGGPRGTDDSVETQIEQGVRQVDAEGQVRILGDLSPARGLARAELRHGSVVKEIEHDRDKTEEPVLGPNQLFLRKDRGQVRPRWARAPGLQG